MNYLVDLIIRPTRNLYNIRDLGDFAFTFSGEEFRRIDFNKEIRNEKGHKLSCSLWCPLEMKAKDLSYSPCIIYCHGNAGNKIDIIEIFDFLLWDFNICSFDFSGAGFSEGEHVTLGYFEKYDVKAVVEFLRKELNIQKIILFGRSMGAVSALRYAEMDPNLTAVVLDSPFCDFPRLCEEILLKNFFVPNIISSFLIKMTRNKLIERITDFDIFEFLPYKNANGVEVPVIMIHGISDSLVGIEHSQEIYKNLVKSPCKKLLEVEGEHNDCRDYKHLSIIRDFIMHFSYDPLIVKEHKRRLIIKNSHLNYTEMYGINIDSVINNFKRNIKSDIKRQKREMNNFNIKARKVKDRSEIRSKSFEKKTKDIIIENKLKRSSSIEFLKYNKLINIENKSNFKTNQKFPNQRYSDSLYNNKIDIKKQILDFSIINPNEFDLNHSMKQIDNHTNRLRSKRNNLIGNRLNLETTVKSSQIKFTNIDKSSLRKKYNQDSILNNTEIENNK